MRLNIEELAREAGAVKERDETFGAAYEFELSQLEAFARLIVERCAQECDDISVDKWALYKGRAPYQGNEPGRADPDTQGQSDGADQCAAAIRNLLEY